MQDGLRRIRKLPQKLQSKVCDGNRWPKHTMCNCAPANDTRARLRQQLENILCRKGELSIYTNETRDLLANAATRIGANLHENQLRQFAQYMDMLLKWREKFNLTAISDPRDVSEIHAAILAKGLQPVYTDYIRLLD